MKRYLMCLALVLMLTGCGRDQVPETVPETTVHAAAPAVAAPAETGPAAAEPADSDFVRVLDHIPTARQKLMYATAENFTGQVIYDFQDAYLRYGTVKKLKAVAEDLAEMGMHILIWDGFRPVSAQFTLWEACPDPTYVADPTKGFSSHSRGNTVDLTLVDKDGVEFPMPTGFDDFTEKADRDYSDCTEEARNNAMILELLMEKHGFSGYVGEWWHYTDTDSYPVEEQFEPV